jgi:dimethylhistidine N-methyltransferase
MISADLTIPLDAPRPAAVRFRADVVRGLRSSPKELPSKYFYDRVGSGLFEQITRLPEYYLTRSELAIMRAHAAEMAAVLGRRVLLIEYGSGASTKTRLLLDHLAEPAGYVPIDASAEHLWDTAAVLTAEYPRLEVMPLVGDFTRPLGLPSPRRRPARRVVYFPGSTIGNFTPDDAVLLLRQTARLVGRGGGMLLGADLKKDPARIEASYNDAQGVTAAFNRNVLVRINRELNGDFDPSAFDHRAFYNAGEGRIEMHLVSRGRQVVHVGGEEFLFRAGESVRTEYSYKYDPEDVRQLAEAGGFAVRQAWTDAAGDFCVSYLVAEQT